MRKSEGKNQNQETESLLRTAANAKLGATQTALTAFKSRAPPPIPKVRVPISDETRVSEMSGSLRGEGDTRVGRTGAGQIEKESTVTKANSTSKRNVTKPSFDGPKTKAKMPRALVGTAIKTTPQPKNLPSQALKLNKVEKRSMEIHKGIRISAPSPMSLDRIQVQHGQERVLPESKELKAQQAELRRQQEIETKEALYQEAKQEVKRQLKLEKVEEHREGFETQLRYEACRTGVADGSEKDLVKKIIKKIKPIKDSPSHLAEARFLARRALQASKKGTRTTGFDFVDLQQDVPPALQEFPVSEIMMGEDNPKHDDGSISTIGNPHVHVVRQQVNNTNALIDQIDSGTVLEDGTEAAIEQAMNGAGCQANNGRSKEGIGSPLGCSIGGICFGAMMGHQAALAASPEEKAVVSQDGTRNHLIDAEAVFLDREVKERLTRMNISNNEPGDALNQHASPRSDHSMPELEGGEIIDLTTFPLLSPSNNDDTGGQLEATSPRDGIVNGDDQERSGVGDDDDRYAVERDENPAEELARSPKSLLGEARENAEKLTSDIAIEDEEAMPGATTNKETKAENRNQESPNVAYGDLDPSPGVICGAVPLYFFYSTKKNAEEEENNLLSRLADINKNASECMENVTMSNSEASQKEESQNENFSDKEREDQPQNGKFGMSERYGRRDKVLLDNDDAYWDTLSTIASTRGLDFEKFAPILTNPSPGPIPIEITMSKEGSEKDEADSRVEGKKEKHISQPMKIIKTEVDHADQSLSYSHGTTENDDKAQTNPCKTVGGKVNANTKKRTHLKPMPETYQPEEHKATSSFHNWQAVVEQKGGINGQKDKKASESTQKNSQERSVTWGFEEIYEAPEDSSPQNQLSKKESLDYQEEQKLLSRTLQLSKDLLASLAHQELGEADTDVVKLLLSFGSDEDSQTKLSLTEPATVSIMRPIERSVDETSHESPIDVDKLLSEYGNFPPKIIENYNEAKKAAVEGRESDESGSISNRNPEILSKLDVLRSQRAQSLARFQSSRTAPTLAKSGISDRRERNHLQVYSGSTIGLPQNKPFIAKTNHQAQEERIIFDGTDGIESESSLSGDSTRTTPSKKARDLRRQLDEALHASREIRLSQEKLGNDLQTFKSRFYQKNGELEDQAIWAMRNSVTQQL